MRQRSASTHPSPSSCLSFLRVIIEFIHILGCKKRRHTSRRSKHHLQNHQNTQRNLIQIKSENNISFHRKDMTHDTTESIESSSSSLPAVYKSSHQL